MIAAVIAFFKSKGGAVLAGVIAILGVLAAVFARGRSQGKIEQRIAQEDIEHAREAELRKIDESFRVNHEARVKKMREDIEEVERRAVVRSRTAGDVMRDADDSAKRAKEARDRSKS